MALIQTTFADSVGSISLDHYEKRNALSESMVNEIIASLDKFKSQGARTVILRSASAEKVWSAGHSVDELPRADIDPLPYDDPLERLLQAVRTFPAPVIAMIQGSVWGGACDLVINCDIIIGDETAAFAITPAKLGLPYNVSGLLNFMNRLPLVVVKEMFFTADLIGAERAENLSLVNKIVPAAELEAEVNKMAQTIVSRSATSISVAKEALHALSEASSISPIQYEYIQSLRRNAYFGSDYLEGIQAFTEKRAPNFSKPAPKA
ncbi:methylmalonyl-CoA decarboxylase [Cerasicoccus arenae]|uniref:Methylmalonyl-CoA decarboxylase n=1 Tax=Cerasicoccus arenae TaxID=424488 RepID=A0A8J3D9T4_9BACT|nr:methylmalonyl-CoA decarboxylase [Cerasicoccus arenae]MBK1857150.1 methylmalonyl-CoA decarboxylase [Cerasicoccus arenae]GHB92645.1 methylmalonyl-CoA decarboxylase [Cerasicoccus arenae]